MDGPLLAPDHPAPTDTPGEGPRRRQPWRPNHCGGLLEPSRFGSGWQGGDAILTGEGGPGGVEPGELEWFPQARAGPLRHLPVRLLLPVFLTFAWYIGCSLLLPEGKALIFGGLLLAYFIPPSGKESVIPLGIIVGIPWQIMAASVVVLDVLTGLFMILNLDFAFKIPYLGPWIARVLGGGKGFLAKRPWLSRWGLPGLAFFVMLPFQGTGGTGAPLVGWMLGLKPWEILLAIALGSELIWSLATTYLTYQTAVILALAIIALLALTIYLLGRREQA